MPFTPSEIKNKEFTRVKNGLEPTEVANYLEQLSNEIERLKEDKKQLEKVIEDRDSNIKSYKDVHQSVSDALIQAQKVGEETKQAATKEAEAVLSKAQVQADSIVEERAMKQKQNQELSANQPSTSSSESVSQSNANNESSQSTSNN